MFSLRVGLTEKRYLVLNVLDKLGIATVDQIMRLTSFNKSTIYYALKEFEKKRFNKEIQEYAASCLFDNQAWK